jgi:hypothetical protein
MLGRHSTTDTTAGRIDILNDASSETEAEDDAGTSRKPWRARLQLQLSALRGVTRALTWWAKISWLHLFLYAAGAYVIISSTVLIGVEAPTPIWEIHEVLPTYISSFFAGEPKSHPCAPCGCGVAVPRDFGDRSDVNFIFNAPPRAGGSKESKGSSLHHRPTGSSGASGVSALSGDFCIGDAELARLSALDVPLQPTAANAEAVRLRARILRMRQSALECFDVLDDVHVSSAAASETLAVPASARAHVLWHWYWRSSSSSSETAGGAAKGGQGLNASQLDALTAWLVTQDPDRSTLIVWVPTPGLPPASLEPLARLFPGRIRYRVLDVAVEAEGSPLARSYLLSLHDEKAWADSDVARLVLLWRYGGVYFDTDMLFVRAITPLLGLEFATEFSCDHAQSDFNNAIMRFFAKSPAATALCEAAKAKWPRLRQWVFGPYVLRSAFGSPLWRTMFGGDPPFQSMP